MRQRQLQCLSIAAVVMLALAIVTGGCGRRQAGAGSLQIKGSDTMVNLGQAWAEAFMKKHPDLSAAVTGGGSGTGVASLISRTCDIAELSRELTPDELRMAREKGLDPRQVTVALDGLAVVVHPSNSVTRLTVAQLADIFSGVITNWKDLGGADLGIVVLSREVNSGTHVYFKEHVLHRGKKESRVEFAKNALLLSSSQAIADEAAQNPGAIGYYGMGYISSRQKVVAVATDDRSPYVLPTIANVIGKSYPISRPLLMVTPTEPKGLTARFIDFVLSPEGQGIVSKLDFVPVSR